MGAPANLGTMRGITNSATTTSVLLRVLGEVLPV